MKEFTLEDFITELDKNAIRYLRIIKERKIRKNRK